MLVENRKMLWGVFLFGCLTLILKLFIIDIDPPGWAISQYAAIDEYYYVHNAYNLYEIGNPFGSDSPMLFGNPMLTNILTYLSLNVFGDNYLGLRFSSFIFGFSSYILLFSLLRRVKINSYIICGILLFTIFNFTIANSNFIVEPSVSRIFCILLSIYFILKWKEKPSSRTSILVLQSAIISLLWIFSYPTNAFVMLGFYIVMVLDKDYVNKDFFKRNNLLNILSKSIYYVVGVSISMVIYYLFSKALGLDLLDNSITRSSKYSNRLALNIKDIIKYFLFNFRANIFVLNPLFLFVTVIALLNIELRKIKSWPILKYIVFVFLVAFFIQSLFINDFPERKLIIYFPFVSILIGFYLNDKKTISTYKPFAEYKFHTLFMIGFIGVIASVYYKYSHLDALAWSIAIIGLLFLVGNQVYFKLKKNKVLYVMFFLIITPETINVLNYHLVNRTYFYRETAKSLSEFKNSKFIGGFSMGFRAYNTIQTSVNLYYYYGQHELQSSVIDKLRTNGVKDYSIDYKSNAEEMESRGFVPLKSLLYTPEDKEWIIYQEKIVK